MMVKNNLFKAKRVDNGEWIEGSLITGMFFRLGKDIPYILCPEKAEFDCFEDIDEGNGIYEVDVTTLCKFTGRYDKNGNKIWEHDIVGFLDISSYDNGYSEHYCIGQVVWDDETLTFEVTERLSCESYEALDGDCERIGNVFDNPELLETMG